MLNGCLTALRTARVVVLTMALGLAIPANADEEPGASGVQPWSLLLRQQLQQDKGCTVVDILSSNEFKVGDETMLEGRVSCVDGRQFDFNRRQPHMKFEFRICDPVVC